MGQIGADGRARAIDVEFGLVLPDVRRGRTSVREVRTAGDDRSRRDLGGDNIGQDDVRRRDLAVVRVDEGVGDGLAGRRPLWADRLAERQACAVLVAVHFGDRNVTAGSPGEQGVQVAVVVVVPPGDRTCETARERGLDIGEGPVPYLRSLITRRVYA
jgi:hypothetical protein